MIFSSTSITSNKYVHSSRMRTARLLTISRSIQCISGWGSATRGGLHVWGEGLHPGGVINPGGSWADPLVNRMTDSCKNITLPQTSFAGGKKV